MSARQTTSDVSDSLSRSSSDTSLNRSLDFTDSTPSQPRVHPGRRDEDGDPGQRTRRLLPSSGGCRKGISVRGPQITLLADSKRLIETRFRVEVKEQSMMQETSDGMDQVQWLDICGQDEQACERAHRYIQALCSGVQVEHKFPTGRRPPTDAQLSSIELNSKAFLDLLPDTESITIRGIDEFDVGMAYSLLETLEGSEQSEGVVEEPPRRTQELAGAEQGSTRNAGGTGVSKSSEGSGLNKMEDALLAESKNDERWKHATSLPVDALSQQQAIAYLDELWRVGRARMYPDKDMRNVDDDIRQVLSFFTPDLPSIAVFLDALDACRHTQRLASNPLEELLGLRLRSPLNIQRREQVDVNKLDQVIIMQHQHDSESGQPAGSGYSRSPSKTPASTDSSATASPRPLTAFPGLAVPSVQASREQMAVGRGSPTRGNTSSVNDAASPQALRGKTALSEEQAGSTGASTAQQRLMRQMSPTHGAQTSPTRGSQAVSAKSAQATAILAAMSKESEERVMDAQRTKATQRSKAPQSSKGAESGQVLEGPRGGRDYSAVERADMEEQQNRLKQEYEETQRQARLKDRTVEVGRGEEEDSEVKGQNVEWGMREIEPTARYHPSARSVQTPVTQLDDFSLPMIVDNSYPQQFGQQAEGLSSSDKRENSASSTNQKRDKSKDSRNLLQDKSQNLAFKKPDKLTGKGNKKQDRSKTSPQSRGNDSQRGGRFQSPAGRETGQQFTGHRSRQSSSSHGTMNDDEPELDIVAAACAARHLEWNRAGVSSIRAVGETRAEAAWEAVGRRVTGGPGGGVVADGASGGSSGGVAGGSDEGASDANNRLRHIVIDGCNVAMSHGKNAVFSCRGLQIVINYFLARGHRDITALVPQHKRQATTANNPGTVADRALLEQLHAEGYVIFTPSRRLYNTNITPYDDRFVLNLAAETDGIVVSNDNYRDLQDEHNPKWLDVLKNRILPFSFVNDIFMVPDDPLGRYGPRLDEFLSKPVRRESALLTPTPPTAAPLPPPIVHSAPAAMPPTNRVPQSNEGPTLQQKQPMRGVSPSQRPNQKSRSKASTNRRRSPRGAQHFNNKNMARFSALQQPIAVDGDSDDARGEEAGGIDPPEGASGNVEGRGARNPPERRVRSPNSTSKLRSELLEVFPENGELIDNLLRQLESERNVSKLCSMILDNLLP